MVLQRSPQPTIDFEVAGRSTGFSFAHRVCRDIDEQANSINGWEQTYAQMSAGNFSGYTIDLCFDHVQVFRETTDQHLHQSGSAPRGCYVFGVPVK